MASMGHVRDLPAKSISVDVNDSFKPTYEIIPTRKKVVTDLKKAAKNAAAIYLATDLDREGEAIAWHLVEALGIDPEICQRVIFNAITKKAIQDAFATTHKLEIDRVNAQQARRILDRIVGYEISPLLWKKVARGLSAGRVQSVAVKLVVNREREILAFVPEEYWKISGIFSTSDNEKITQEYLAFLESFKDKPATVAQRGEWLSSHNSIETQLTSFAGKNFRPDNEAEAKKIYKALDPAQYKISEIKTRRTKSSPAAPFITSTLQQQAANRLGFATKRTMRVAQQLYEGLELGGLGSIGLITYMRTDSTHLAPEALQAARGFIGENFGPEYLPEKPNFYGTSNKSAQEAHEAVRPTDVTITPESIKSYLGDEQFKLYQLIWKRFVACQMTQALWDVTSVSVTAETDLGQAVFKASGRVLVFDGFMKVAGVTVSNGDQILPEMAEQQQIYPVKVEPTQHFTAPPARFTEASLVKTLEAEGIGRPSTYASIISTIQDRGYVEQLEKKFHATDLGIVVTDKLNDHFPRVMDLAFTSHMEQQLDKIEEQHLDWVEVLTEFYGPFKENLERAHEEMSHAKAETQPSEYTCPDCKSPLVYRFGKNGRFLSCSDYPTCKFASPCDREGKICEPETTEHKCPNCGKPMILRKGRFGTFLGCADYPECKTTQQMDKEGNVLPPKAPPKPSGIRCYKCEGDLVIRESKRGPFLGCGRFPRCRTIISIKNWTTSKNCRSKAFGPRKHGKKPTNSWPQEKESRPQRRFRRNPSSKKKQPKRRPPKKQQKRKLQKKTTATETPEPDSTE